MKSFIVTETPQEFRTVEAAEQFAAQQCHINQRTFFVIPVENRIPGMKAEYVGVMMKAEEE